MKPGDVLQEHQRDICAGSTADEDAPPFSELSLNRIQLLAIDAEPDTPCIWSENRR